MYTTRTGRIVIQQGLKLMPARLKSPRASCFHFLLARQTGAVLWCCLMSNRLTHIVHVLHLPVRSAQLLLAANFASVKISCKLR